ncbi:hypothetical protein Nepgr_030388 [Nepenthes gracilis]|uniref:Uncharacterized protein n=1 Tax=Nepenthes gracilis TaxID=150966 RepID=A0AAD3Y5Q8_NEPGR|nr:hypothetical protein Nepgr_030388 [Nepenthes gracilis]
MSASYGRSRSGDRFYNPPAVRRQLQLQQQQLLLQKQKKENQESQEKQKQLRHQSPAALRTAKSLEESENRTASDDCVSSATPPPPSSVSSHLTSSASNLTNLDRFLEYTTPLVPAQSFSKTSLREWRTIEDEFQPYFVLGDLWESFKEWSAYGVGVPLLLNENDSVVQYYVPYLSGIQLYIDQSRPSPRIRRPGEESDADSSREHSSDSSSDHETERGPNYFFQGEWSQQDLTEANIQGLKRLALRNKTVNGSSSDEGELCSSPGVLVFEYMEHDPPYSREPLADKISLLASQVPDLKTYRSCDLSPASWVSVAWYPIYRIPTGPTLQNLDSCFLTFHFLSTPTRGAQNEWRSIYGSCPREVQNGLDMPPKMSLPVFGLASYKFKVSIWDQSGVKSQRANSLLQNAEEWLRNLNVNHPDYSLGAVRTRRTQKHVQFNQDKGIIFTLSNLPLLPTPTSAAVSFWARERITGADSKTPSASSDSDECACLVKSLIEFVGPKKSEDMGSSMITPEDVLESLMNDGTIDALRLKIINQLKANEELKKTTMTMVEQSKVLNTPGAEKQTKRELFDALRQELEAPVLEKASKSVWELVLDNNGLGKDISETVERVFCRLSGRDPPLFLASTSETQLEKENEIENLSSSSKKRSFSEMSEGADPGNNVTGDPSAAREEDSNSAPSSNVKT